MNASSLRLEIALTPTHNDQRGTNIVMCLRGNAPVRVRAHTALRGERIDVAQFAIVPDLDMAGARGAAIAARTIVLGD